MKRIVRRAFIATGLTSAIAGCLSSDGEKEEDQTPNPLPRADVTSLEVTPSGQTVDEYSGFQLKAEYETEYDGAIPPKVYVVDTVAETITEQSPIEDLDKGSGTWEMGFWLPENVEQSTTVLVHMDGQTDRFEVGKTG